MVSTIVVALLLRLNEERLIANMASISIVENKKHCYKFITKSVRMPSGAASSA